VLLIERTGKLTFVATLAAAAHGSSPPAGGGSATHTRIARARDRLTALQERGKLAVLTALGQRTARVERAARLLAAVSYRAVLARGFALARNVSGKPLRNAAAIDVGLRFDIEFSDGRVRALSEARSIAAVTETLPAKPRRRSGGEGQGSLFGT